MAKTRRRNDGLGEEVADDLYQMLRHLPWWAGPIFMLGGWLLFAYGLPAFLGPLGSGEISPGRFLGTMPRNLAWLAPLGIGALWLVALLNKAQDGQLLAQQRTLEDVRDLDWRAFEQLMAEAYRRRGYMVTKTIAGADGGVDLVLEGRESGQLAKVFVQCKQWRQRQVGVRPVRELAGVVAAAGGQAAGVRGIFATSGHYTDEACRFAEQAAVELVDGEELMELLAEVQGRGIASGETLTNTVPAPQAPATPSCPRCGAAMVRRTARRGARSGNEFWGCTGFPTCRGTRQLTGAA